MTTATATADAGVFEEHRAHLLGIAYRMTGTLVDAEDLVQEAWLRWQSEDRGGVVSPRSYLATIVTRLALDHLKSARVRREHYVGPWLPEPAPGTLFAGETSPEREAEVRDSLSYAFVVLLERLAPLERAVFLLRDVFDYDYREIAEVVDRSEAACRQTLHRARGRLSEGRARFACGYQQRLRLLHAFARAAGEGDMEALTSVLADDVVTVSDGGGKRPAALNPIRGADRVARFLIGAARREPRSGAFEVELNGVPAVAVYYKRTLLSLFFVEPSEDGRIGELYVVRNPEKLAVAHDAILATGRPLRGVVFSETN
jgi:RNA polymerase sigma-70 factor (ECF subfamily)